MNEHFAGFAHAATELSAYIHGAGIFIISLKNKQVINYEPEEVEAFINWLNYHHIRDVQSELPKHIYEVLIKEEKKLK